MHLHQLLRLAFSVAPLLNHVADARIASNAVLLSNVQTLTLRNGQKTSHRRVSAIPQLKCVGGNARGLYEVDVMRCKNSGSGYDDANVQWTCTAALPPEFKLGSTEVICEGYSSPDDPYVLKGSCGVEYRLVLTEAGEQKYGNRLWSGGGPLTTKSSELANWIFWLIFFAVLAFIAKGWWDSFARNGGRRRGGGFGGWGGGGGGGGNDDPPPPYDWRPQPKPYRSTYGTGANQGWQPGFWSGLLGGAAAGYFAGNRQNRQPQVRDQYVYGRSGPDRWGSGAGIGGGGSFWDRGEGSSRGPSNSAGSARYESTGFGSTRRR